jgi:hypothetical protein
MARLLLEVLPEQCEYQKGRLLSARLAEGDLCWGVQMS